VAVSVTNQVPWSLMQVCYKCHIRKLLFANVTNDLLSQSIINVIPSAPHSLHHPPPPSPPVRLVVGCGLASDLCLEIVWSICIVLHPRQGRDQMGGVSILTRAHSEGKMSCSLRRGRIQRGCTQSRPLLCMTSRQLLTYKTAGVVKSSLRFGLNAKLVEF